MTDNEPKPLSRAEHFERAARAYADTQYHLLMSIGARMMEVDDANAGFLTGDLAKLMLFLMSTGKASDYSKIAA